MTTITADAVKELRERTGAGMMDCKNALVEADGDLEKAVGLLRERGLARSRGVVQQADIGCPNLSVEHRRETVRRDVHDPAPRPYRVVDDRGDVAAVRRVVALHDAIFSA